MTEIIVRPAGANDAGLIADLSRQTFNDSFAEANTKEDMDQFMHEQFSREALIKEVETGDGIFFLAFEGGHAVGYMRMRDGDYHPAFGDLSSIEIARIYAVKTSIGKGVGRALVNQAIQTARELNRQLIWLGVWEHNQRAIDFYTKWGFEKFGQHAFLLGSDRQNDWLMKKQL